MNFQEALYKQYECLFSSLSKKGIHIDVNDVEFHFTRNLPVNEAEEIDSNAKLVGLVSEKTRLSRLGFIPDPELEQKQMLLEKEAAAKLNPVQNTPKTEDNLDESNENPEESE